MITTNVVPSKKRADRKRIYLARTVLRTCGSLAIVVPLLAPGEFVFGQETGADTKATSRLEEIVVTGTKRELSAQDVPISVSTVTEQDLARSPFNDVRALGQRAPGLVLSNPAGFNATGGGMRGTGTNIILVTQDAPVSFLVDEFVLSHVTSQFLTLFDVQQIEVYRGPQGTLFGKNATGGVIGVTSKKPILGEREVQIEATYGTYTGDADYYDVKAALNIPINDTMAVRIAAIADFDDGYYEDSKGTATFPTNVPLWGAFGIPPGTPLPPEVDPTVTGTGDPLGGKEVYAAKGKLMWEPSETFSAYLIGEVVRDRSDSPPGVNESVETDLLTLLGFPGIGIAGEDDPFGTLISHNDVIHMDAGHKVDVDSVFLTLDWELGFGTVKSITGYRDESQEFPSTYTGEAFKTLFDSTRNTNRETIQQEFRFISDFEGPFNFVAGASYFHDEFDFLAYFSVGLISLLPVPDPVTGTFVTPGGVVSLDTRALFDYQFQGTEQRRNEYGLYFDGTYDVNDQWSVTGGVRLSYDEKEFLRFVDGGGPCTAFTAVQDQVIINGECRDTRSQYISRAGLPARAFDGSIPLPLSAFGTVVDTDDNWFETTYRAVLNFERTDDELIYLSYATGFLSGGFSETCATLELCAYDPETNANLELGYKIEMFDRTLRLNAAVFYTWYEDLQRAVVAVYTAADGSSQQETVTVNAGKSEAYGFDLEATWLPTEAWRLGAALNLLSHDYTGGELPDLRGTNQPVDLEQFDVPFSPTVKAMADAEYQFPFAGGMLSLYGSVNYQSKGETDVFNGVNTEMEARTLVDLSATYRSADDQWSVTAFVANLLDEEYRVAALPVAGLWNFTSFGAPRSGGVRVNYRFGE